MGFFGRKQPPVQPPRPAGRTIPVLEPDYFESIHERLIASGGNDSSTRIAAGVGNAIYNTASNYLQRVGADQTLRAFETLYADRSPQDRGAADRMIDFLVAYDRTVQTGEGGWLSTLLARLDDVLSRRA